MMAGVYNKLSLQDVKINRRRLQQISIQADLNLMKTKLSLYTFLRRKLGDLSQNKHLWIQELERMREHEYSFMVQNEAVKSLLGDLTK